MVRKIPREEWPSIVARRAKGESLASIARAYRCTAPAIRYVVGIENPSAGSAARSAGRPRAGASPHLGGETQQGRQTRSEDREAFNTGLRDTVTVDISAFLIALDRVISEPTALSRDQLREATDRLMRAAAKIRIELERPRGLSSGLGPAKLAE